MPSSRALEARGVETRFVVEISDVTLWRRHTGTCESYKSRRRCVTLPLSQPPPAGPRALRGHIMPPLSSRRRHSCPRCALLSGHPRLVARCHRLFLLLLPHLRGPKPMSVLLRDGDLGGIQHSSVPLGPPAPGVFCRFQLSGGLYVPPAVVLHQFI